MKIVYPSVELLKGPKYDDLLKFIEKVGRTCYKSEDKITAESAENFVRGLIKRGHLAMIEHETITVKFVCDRGVSHELVRHRLASFAQESTRYCNYSGDQFGREITVIQPCWLEKPEDGYPETTDWDVWAQAMEDAEEKYMELLDMGWSPQQARTVLPNSLKTEVVVTMNIREWRHFFNLRAIGTTGAPHPQMKQVAWLAFDMFKENWPVFFEDLEG